MILPKMSAKAFAHLLEDEAACDEGFEWADGKTLQKAFATCPRPDWLLWLLDSQADNQGWPTTAQVQAVSLALAETVAPKDTYVELFKSALDTTRALIADPRNADKEEAVDLLLARVDNLILEDGFISLSVELQVALRTASHVLDETRWAAVSWILPDSILNPAHNETVDMALADLVRKTVADF